MSTGHESVDLVGDNTVQYFALAVLLAALMAAMAKVKVPYPLSPTDITLQVMGVAIAGLVLGPLWGGFSMLLYLLVGFAGAPVFTDGGGPGYLWHHTAGFLVGFLVAAVVIGAIVHRQFEPRDLDSVSLPLQVFALLAGVAVTYAFGVPWLGFITGLSLPKAAVSGALVFVPADLAKVAATIALVRGGHLVRP
jgi:biotin transport system substrate-specific component